MPQQFQQPQRGRNRGVYDEEPEGTFPQSLYRQESEPSNYGDTSDIDDALAENDKVMSAEALAGQESNASGSGSNPADAPQSSYREEDPKGDQNDSRLQKAKAKISGLSKRAKIGVISGSVLGLGSLGLFFGSGSLMLPHLSQLLSLDGQQNERTSDIRLNALYRYARSGGNIGETRVSMLGARKFHASIAELEKIGVTFETNEKVGVFKGTTIDKTKFPALQGVPDDKIPAKLASYFQNKGITSANITVSGNNVLIGGENGNRLSLGARRAIANDSIRQLDGGKISHWLKARQIKKFYNLPSIFHPLRRVDARISDNIDARLNSPRAQAKKEERARKNPLREARKAERAAAYANLKDKTSGFRAGAGAALLITASTCLARSAADDAIEYNRSAVVVPEALEAADLIAVGAQQMSGQDFTPEQLDTVNKSLSDPDGKTIWQSKALNSKTNPTTNEGEELEEKYAQSFSSNGAANKLSEVGGVGGELACSPVGQGVQIVAGLVLAAAAIPSGGGTAAAYGALKIAGGAAAGAVAMIAISDLITSSLSEDPIPEDLAAPVKGNLLAYGSRELANITARASGGIDLGENESAAIDQRIAASQKAEFQSKTFFARMFDASDYRSVAGTFVRSNSSRTQDLKNVATSLTSIIPSTLKMMRGLSPSVAAAEPYNYGFNRYGIPESILNNEAYDDPYANADQAAVLFNSGSGGDYIDKAKKCFGVNITKDSGGLWAVVGEDDVNPNSKEYQDANCNDISDSNWVRTFLFVEDSMEMEASACYLGEEESCKTLGVTNEENVCSVEKGTAVTGFPSWAKFPVINAPIGGPVNGNINAVAVNAKHNDTLPEVMRTIANNDPDFIAVNEVSDISLDRMESITPGFGAYRDNSADGTEGNPAQALGNMIMWKKDKWSLLQGGRIKITEDDKPVYGGLNPVWDRFAMWGVFKRKSDGAIVPFIATHMMTNPKYRAQHSNPPMTRPQQYDLSMDILLQLAAILSAHGPVIVGGDMNTHGNEGDWAAIPRMEAAGFGWASEVDVMYVFNPKGTKKVNHRLIPVPLKGDHSNGAQFLKIDMNGAGPGAIEGVGSATTTPPGEECNDIGSVNYKNPVYSDSAPDPSVIKGDDGTYHVYATGEVHLTSKDMVNWKKASGGWNLKGAPNLAGGAKWAPDIAKVGSKYVFTYTIPTGTPEIGGGGSPKIGYALGSSANGPFQYKGTLNLPYPYSIDSNLFVDDDEKLWLYWGGGAINVIQMKLEGEALKTVGSMKQVLTKGGVGSPSATIEGAYVVKRDGWYYLTYSQGNFKRTSGAPEYQVLVARSKNPNGPFQPNDSMRTILEGKGDIHFPGHHSIMTDDSGNDWMVYHGYYKNETQTRSLMIDPMKYENGWPIVDGPSSTTKQGPAVNGLNGDSSPDSVGMKDDYKAPQCENFRAGGAPGLACDGECVDFVKFRLKKNIDRNKFSSIGHGKDVVSGLGANYGYKIDNKPAVNSVASWKAGQYDMNSTYGHTAMVSAVNKDGSIVVEEYNVTGGKYTTRKIPASQASQLTYAHTEVDFK